MSEHHSAYTVDPGAVVRMPPMPQPPPSNRRAVLVGMVAILVFLALVIGIAIGRVTVEDPAPVVAASNDRGRLKVVSIPADGNVTLDGRFVGVAPLENLDLDPGKHSIVIDVFGYQPYAGTVEVEPRASAKLTIALAPLGATESTTGTVSGGGGIAKPVKVPRSALQPSTGNTAAGAPDAKTSRPPARTPSADPPARPPSVYIPPPRPRRDCSGENSTCRDGCYRAGTDCDFSCVGCTSCSSSMGWDECKRQCDSCRNSCKQNKNFCESSCETQKRNCDSQNNY